MTACSTCENIDCLHIKIAKDLRRAWKSTYLCTICPLPHATMPEFVTRTTDSVTNLYVWKLLTILSLRRLGELCGWHV